MDYLSSTDLAFATICRNTHGCSVPPLASPRFKATALIVGSALMQARVAGNPQRPTHQRRSTLLAMLGVVIALIGVASQPARRAFAADVFFDNITGNTVTNGSAGAPAN